MATGGSLLLFFSYLYFDQDPEKWGSTLAGPKVSATIQVLVSRLIIGVTPEFIAGVHPELWRIHYFNQSLGLGGLGFGGRRFHFAQDQSRPYHEHFFFFLIIQPQRTIIQIGWGHRWNFLKLPIDTHVFKRNFDFFFQLNVSWCMFFFFFFFFNHRCDLGQQCKGLIWAKLQF